jgi:FKBP-type peptidyl-prolyl cis-trans isomerase FkpA
MKQKINIGLLAVFAISIVACTKTSYKKTKGGMPYKIFRSNDTEKVAVGDYVKYSLVQKINDSVFLSTLDGLPVYQFVTNEETQPYTISELWTDLHNGDSLVMVQMMDTFLNRSRQKPPPGLKYGDRVISCLKVLGIFHSDSLMRIDDQKGKDQFLVKEKSKIEKFLADHHLQAKQTPSGAYVEMIHEGTGPSIDTGKYITMNYSGTSWSGKKFDSNTDTAFHHMGPVSFVTGQQPMIKGFDEGLLMLSKGSQARIYIPSMLGYGLQPPTPLIKPYESLIFDIQILDVQDKAPALQKVDATQQKNN